MEQNGIQPKDYIPNIIKDKDLFYSIQQRIPKIIVNSAEYFIANYREHLKNKDEHLSVEQLIEADEDAKRIERELIDYSKEIIEDHVFVRMDDHRDDTNLWNLKLDEWNRKHPNPPTYTNVPFLWAECYIYRRLIGSFFKSKYFDNFDVFKKTKQNGFLRSKIFSTAIVEYAAGIADRLKEKQSTCEEELEIFLHFALWGNQFDLSGPIYDRIIKNFKLIDQEKKSKIVSESVINDLYQHFKRSANGVHQITFILDNSGFELLSDLCFVEMLYQTGLLDEKSKIVFHCKSFAWFVSDTVDQDFVWLLDSMANEFESNAVKSLAKKWSNLLADKNWQLKTHLFWQTPYGFDDMSRLAPDLYAELSKSDLVIICGDLNYRKLINDYIEDPYATFETVLHTFKPTNILALRTVKSRPLVGLNRNIKFTRSDSSKSKVFWHQDYAVIHFFRKV